MEATTPFVQAPTWTSEDNNTPYHLPTTLVTNKWLNNQHTDKSILTTSSLLCNFSLLHYSSTPFILGLTCCLFLSILSLSFLWFLICAHSALFTFSLLFSFCSLSLSFIHTAHTVVLPFYSSTHFFFQSEHPNHAQSLRVSFIHYNHFIYPSNP